MILLLLYIRITHTKRERERFHTRFVERIHEIDSSQVKMIFSSNGIAIILGVDARAHSTSENSLFLNLDLWKKKTRRTSA